MLLTRIIASLALVSTIVAQQVIFSDAAKQPKIPDGLQYSHYSSPYTPNLEPDNSNYPVLVLGDIEYWAASYKDNRDSFNLLAYSTDGKLRGSCELKGARYLYTILKVNDTINFIGQSLYVASIKISNIAQTCVTFDGKVEVKDATTTTFKWPTGVVYTHTDPTTGIEDNKNYPVLVINGYYSFWGTSSDTFESLSVDMEAIAGQYVDNRSSFAIVVVDPKNEVVGFFELKGARYFETVTVKDDTATFTGQNGWTATATFEQLMSSF